MNMKKTIKYIFYFIVLIFFLWWFFLSHVTFLKKEREISDRNGEYIAKYYNPLPINLFGVYYQITERDPIFVVLYDKHGKYIGQSSPFNMTRSFVFFDANPTLPEKNPKDLLDNHFYIVIVGDGLDDAYDIDINHKKWWSKILKYFH
ncbi:DUF6201 family protein [Photorhabdus tasmaniensis]|uniref:DUF943 family protein n=1 Tax=Photorhabdus tasmaniensis TaxID=1004159 RepID=A0ABX0GJ06_9GAMM|nr:DUF6201 family protein [Photorhabdus tasmaniensis]NHB87879.1 hypothetical protein [Photorhabdus tasmaniensis]